MCCSLADDGPFAVLLGVALIAASETMPGSLAAAPSPAGPAPVATSGEVDLRPLFDRWDLPPRAQGDRNTCSVFAVTGAIEFALAEKQGRGTRLSVEFLNWA